MWKGYQKYDHAFSIVELDEFFDEISEDDIDLVGKEPEYLNIPASFDIETTSVKDGDDKFATMYIWQLGINGSVLYGRTWKEFIEVSSQLVEFFELEPSKRHLIVYVHNLGYEFQFMRGYFNWLNVFAIKNRRPIYALTDEGIEFRCSLLLSNYALAYVGSNLLMKYPVQKMVGDLDYSKIRHSLTPITDAELGYCLNDARVVMSYIQEKIEQDGDITKIPLTNTGYVRNYCRELCYGLVGGEYKSNKQKYEYRALMKNLTITSEREYDDLKNAFAGGFTHANAFHSGDILHNVGSADLCSSYPAVMVMEQFPMSRGIFIGEVTPSQLAAYIENFCCLFTVEFTNIENYFIWESYISTSRCIYLSDDHIANNGRLSSASKATITITELDWDIINQVYSWDDIKIYGLRVYKRDYLPKVFIEAILGLYKAKTTLKGLPDKVVEYMVSKNMANASFGMAVTDIVRDEYTYIDDAWGKEEADRTSQLVSYNKNFQRFLFYPWGVWVTAHARHNLWQAILEFGEHYVYSDTDSIKGIAFDKHEKFFEDYNARIFQKIAKVSTHYKILITDFMPKTKKGVTKMIGVFEREENYKVFKTLGAKRYIYVYENGDLGLTTSGVNKKYAIPYLMKQFLPAPYNSDEYYELYRTAYNPRPDEYDKSTEAFEKIRSLNIDYEAILVNFAEDLEIPAGYSGKQTLTYIDEPKALYLTDYLGKSTLCVEKSAIHMEPASYLFSISEQYKKFLAGIKEEYY